MNPLAELTGSLRGWADIVAGRPDAGRHFRPSANGIAVAAGWFVAALLLSVAVQSIIYGMPGGAAVAFGLAAQAVTVLLLGLAYARTLRFFQLAVPLNVLLVPTLYALAYMFIVGIPLTLIAPAAGLIAILVVGVMVWRAARVLAAIPQGIAVGLAVLTVIVLVVVPMALYMGSLLLPSAA